MSDTEANRNISEKIVVRVATSYTSCQMLFVLPDPPSLSHISFMLHCLNSLNATICVNYTLERRAALHFREFLVLISVWLYRPVGGLWLVFYIIDPKNKHLH